jgi:hypothetical protein
MESVHHFPTQKEDEDRQWIHTGNTKQLLNLLKLRWKDKEMNDSLTFANAHLSNAIIPIWTGITVLLLIFHTANYVFGKGDAY